MTIDRFVRLFAGCFVLVSLALGAPASPLFHAQGWLWVTAFVGFMLTQSAVTRFCPMEIVLRALGARSSTAPTP